MKNIYIAGPWVFRPAPDDFMSDIRSMLEGSGWNPVFPIDPLPGGTAMDISCTAAIRSHCLAHLDICDAILAEVSPWYGHMPDAGTVFEVGYAAAKGKDVVLWTNDDTPILDRLVAAELIDLDASGNGNHDRYGNVVEDFGSPVNAMLAVYPLYLGVSLACEAIRRKPADNLTREKM